MEKLISLFLDFLDKKWSKWVLLGATALILFLMYPQHIFLFVQLGIYIVLFFFVLKILAPKQQVVYNDDEYMQYCGDFNNNEMRNLVISGGNSSNRFLAVTKILNEANFKKIPTIVLHSGFLSFSQFSQNKFYDPCVGKDSDEIAEILTDAAVNALGIERIVHSSLKFIADLLQAKTDGDITLSDIVKFPCDDILGYLDSCKDDNFITESQYDKFKQRYNNPAIRDNIYKVEPLLSKLKPLAQKENTKQAVNFQQAVSDRQILFFDLLTDANTVLKELIFADLTKLIEISKFLLITEGVSFVGKEDSKVDILLTRNRNNISLVYSGDDVPALTMQTDNTFNTLTGGNTQFLLFAHSSESSAKKWAEHFGEENKTKIGTSTNRGWMLYKGSGTNVGTEKDYKFPPQYFRKLARTTDMNNRAVYWGLDEGECYFIQDDSAVTETKERSGLLLARMMGLAGNTEHNTYLPKIFLTETPLTIESKVS